MSSELKRATGLLVIEVVNSNPNGDPDRERDPPDHLAEHHAGFRGETDRVGTGCRGTRHHVGGRVCRCRGSLVGNFERDKNTETSKIECYGREGIFGKTGKAGDQADGHAAVDSEGDDSFYPGV